MDNKLSLKNIETKRLILIPITLEITKDLLNGNKEEVHKLGITTHEKWPTEDTMDILPIILKALEKQVEPSGFETWMIVKKENMQIIGDIGFFGKPDEKGEVEVGYGLVERERGKGNGFEALQAIVKWVSSMENVKVIKASCLIDNKPSARILEKVGMREVERDSENIYWTSI